MVVFVLAVFEILFAGAAGIVAVGELCCCFYTPIVNLHKNFFCKF